MVIFSKDDDKKVKENEMVEIDLERESPKPEDKDVWAIDYDDNGDFVRWKDLSTKEKVKLTLINITKSTLALSCLYLFICSIGLLGDAFQILAGKSAGLIFSNDSFLSNPISGLILGILVTVLVQSSSTSTSIVTTMVAAQILSVEIAIPIIMGANIGTSVTNTLVSLSQSLKVEEFRKAFAGATILDIFNILTVLILLPVEVASGYLYHVTNAIINSFNIAAGSEDLDFLSVITDPFVEAFVKINKTVITLVAQGVELEPEASMIKTWCGYEDRNVTVTEQVNETVFVTEGTPVNVTDVIQVNTTSTDLVEVPVTKCKSPEDFLFANTGLSDPEAGVILLVVSLVLMCVCLVLMVKLLNSMLKGSVAIIIKKVINLSYKYPFGWLAGYLAILVGAGLTFLFQSSSVFTSSITPLVGIGVISLKRMYPLTLGANIGTTTTSIIAALAQTENINLSLQIALVHLFFNLTGIFIWYVVPIMRRVPIRGAKALGNTTAKYRWFAVLYIIFVFFLIPAALLGLSAASYWAMLAVVILILVIIFAVIVINVLQSRKPNWLPRSMRTWKFLPLAMRSLQPYDRFMTKYLLCCCNQGSNKNIEETNSLSSLSTVSSDGNINLTFEKNEKCINSTYL